MITQEETMMPSRVEPKRNQSDVKNALFTFPSNGQKGTENKWGWNYSTAPHSRIAPQWRRLDALCDKGKHHASSFSASRRTLEPVEIGRLAIKVSSDDKLSFSVVG